MNSALETLHIVAINCFIVCPNFSHGHEDAEPRALWACLGCCSMPLTPWLGLGVGDSHFWEAGCGFRKEVAHFVLFRGSEWQRGQWGNSGRDPTGGFVCNWFSWAWAWGGNTRGEGPEAILFSLSEGRAMPGQGGQSVSISWIWITLFLFTFVLNVVAVTVGFLTTFLFPVNSSYLYLESLPFFCHWKGLGGGAACAFLF